jgi:phosphomannomutase
MGIFKAYDIRGVYPTEINEDVMRRIGNAVAQFLDAKRILVSRDMRPSSPSLAEAFIDGATDTGVDCVDAGLLSTPANYFAIANYGFKGGVSVTASHNPKEYNGLKVSRENAIPVGYDAGLKDVEKMVVGGEYKRAAVKGKVVGINVLDEYRRHVLKFAGDIKPLNVVIDASNGMAGLAMPGILEKLPIRTTRLYFELDGTFPNHEANPLRQEALKDLQETVRKTGADFGAIFDGDADRCAFVDEKGTAIPSDLTTALIAVDMLKGAPGSTVIYDVRSSRAVREEIEKHGGKPLPERVGHAFIKATMRERNAIMGGELSGHYYFRDNFFADSAAIAFLKMLGIVSAAGKPVSKIVEPLRRYFTTGEVNFRVEDKEGKIREIASAFSDGKISWLDGITVEYPEWWFNVRQSNTEPLLRLVLEGNTKELRDKGYERVGALLGTPVKE